MPVASRLTGRDERAALLGALAPLFDDRFVRSCDLFEPYVEALACRAFAATGLGRACRAPQTVDGAIADAGLVPEAARVPVTWLFALLSSCGALARDADRYVWTGAGCGDPDALRAAQAAHDPGCLPAYDLAAYAAAHYPAVLSGAATGESVLASPEALDLWTAYFSNANALYAVSNALGAIAAADALAARGGAVLELGGGLGSGAQAVLERAPAGAIREYRFTDASALFLRRARRALRGGPDAAPMSFAPLDIDAPFADAGVAPRSVALVHAVNVLHVAHDLALTLGEIRASLEADGALVLAECVRPERDRPLHTELVFNLLRTFRAPRLDPRWRPHGGFLTVAQWTSALEANGFRDVRVLPDIEAIRGHYPSFVVAAITARPA